LSYIPEPDPAKGSNSFFGKLDFNGSVIAMSRNPEDGNADSVGKDYHTLNLTE
jgi:hypothetical protein